MKRDKILFKSCKTHKVPAFHGPQLFALHVGEAASDSAEEEPAEERGDDDEGIESIR